MLAQQQTVALLIALLLLAGCRHAANSRETKSTRWRELANSFGSTESANTKESITTNTSQSDDSRLQGAEHFRNIANSSKLLPLDFQATMNRQQQELEANGRVRMPPDQAHDQNRKWKQHWRDNPNDVPVMSEWYKDDYR